MMFCFPFRNAVTGMIVCNVSENKRGVDFLQDKKKFTVNFYHREWGLVPKASDCKLNQNASGLMSGSRS